MKNVSKILGLVLATAALLLSACAKKPIRDASAATQTGPAPTGVNPEAVAVQPDTTTSLPMRDATTGTPGDENKSVVEPIYFPLDGYAVAKAEQPKLDAVVKWLKDNPDKNLVLVGHCDWRGTAEYNLGLGDHRATAVKKFLESKGVDTKRLETLSKGSTDSKQTGGDAEWHKDRRVDFVELIKK